MVAATQSTPRYLHSPRHACQPAAGTPAVVAHPRTNPARHSISTMSPQARPATVASLRLPFSLRGVAGHIAVSVTENTEPEKVGYALLAPGRPLDFARGFPVCRAQVIYPVEGYAAVFGWTQMVRSMTAAESSRWTRSHCTRTSRLLLRGSA